MNISDFNPTNIFESIRSYNGRIFRLDEHLARLGESARTVGLEVSAAEISDFRRIIEKGLAKSGIKNAYIRLALSVPLKNVSLIIKKVTTYPGVCYEKGVSVNTAVVKKNSANAPISRIKSSNFLSAVLAKIESPRTFDALMLQGDGLVAEGTVSNVFIVKRNCLFTPPASSGLLNGVTRQVVFWLAKAARIPAREVNLTRQDLYNADECFLTNTTAEIMPVVEMDGRKIGSAKPGAITRQLMKGFKRLT